MGQRQKVLGPQPLLAMAPSPPLHCPPRHVAECDPPRNALRLQVISVVSKQDPVAWESPAAAMTGPCESVQDDEYFAQARAHTRDECGHYLKPWKQQHAIVIHGRTDTRRRCT